MKAFIKLSQGSGSTSPHALSLKKFELIMPTQHCTSICQLKGQMVMHAKLGRELNEQSEIMDNLSESETMIPRETLFSFVYIAGLNISRKHSRKLANIFEKKNYCTKYSKKY